MIKDKNDKRYRKRMRWNAILDRLPVDRKLLGVEVGVLNGNTAHRILSERPLLTHIMIDPWAVPPAGSSYAKEADSNAQKTQEEHNKAYKVTKRDTAFAGERAKIWRTTSIEAEKKVKEKSVDFVFIDGDHSYEGVKLDISLWLSKIKKGGWIGGHDYEHPKLPGVTKAVNEAFDKSVIKTDDNRTWFVRIDY